MPGVVEWMSLAIMMPNEFIEYLWQHHRADAQDLLGGGLAAFWNSLRTSWDASSGVHLHAKQGSHCEEFH